MNSLPPDLVENVVQRLVSNLQPEQIILFGSYAYGQPNNDSDIDLLIIVSDSDEPGYRRSRGAHKALRGLGVPKDLIVMTRDEVDRKATVRSSLVSQVLREGKTLYTLYG